MRLQNQHDSPAEYHKMGDKITQYREVQERIPDVQASEFVYLGNVRMWCLRIHGGM